MNLTGKYEELLNEYEKLHQAINVIDSILSGDERAYIKEQLARDDLQVLGVAQSKERCILIDEVIERILQARLKS